MKLDGLLRVLGIYDMVIYYFIMSFVSSNLFFEGEGIIAPPPLKIEN